MKSVDELLFRCHLLGDIMPAEKAKTDFTQTCKEKLVEIFNDAMYGRYEPPTESKYTAKGIEQEEMAITLLSMVDKTIYRKNTERLSNDFITGEADIVKLITAPEDPSKNYKKTHDTKCSWSKNTFDKERLKGIINPSYKYQGHGYMALYGSLEHELDYCLVNGTERQILKEKELLSYQDISSETYHERCKEIERNHIFDLAQFVKDNPDYMMDHEPGEWDYDIPAIERIHRKVFYRDEAIIQSIYDRIKECRIWMKENMVINKLMTEKV